MTKLPSHWSFSSLELWHTCRQAWYLRYVKGIKGDGNAFSDYGTYCHKLIEEWAKGELPRIAMAAEYEDGYDEAVAHSFPPFPKGMPARYFEQGKGYFENFNGFGDEFEIIGVEDPFEIELGGNKVVGICDLILRNKNTGDITVIDHKSKTVDRMKKDYDTYVKQLYLYAAAVKQKYGVFPVRMAFNLFRSGEMMGEDFVYSKFLNVMGWIKATIAEIKTEVPEGHIEPHKDQFFCRWLCDCLFDCPIQSEILPS